MDLQPEMRNMLMRNGLQAHVALDGSGYRLIVQGHDSPLLVYPISERQMLALTDWGTNTANKKAYNVLTSIVGNTSAILENGDTLSTEQQRELLRDVNEDAQWLIRMVENLLSITRISGEQTAISKEYEAAEEILAASVHKFEKRFKSNIRIAVEVPQEVVLVPMDATLIQQVLLNLMENAVLHGESTTELRLSVEHIGDEACFTVSDNGLGIPRERLATLFDGSLSGEKGGGFDMKKNMGIGLSVCQTIVKAHGGRITAENRPEGGAQFRFYLPLKEEKEDEDQG